MLSSLWLNKISQKEQSKNAERVQPWWYLF